MNSLAYWASFGAAVGVVFSGAPAFGRDEDGKKLADKRPRIEARPITGGEVRPGDTRRPGGGGTQGGFDSQGITLLSWLPLNALPSDSPSGADCWGYVSPSGREYAIMCVARGTAFLEVTDPLNPIPVGFVAGVESLWHDATVIGSYCYAVSDVYGGYGIQVIDLSQIDSGVVTLVQNKMQNGHSTTHTIVSNPESGYLYLCGANIGNGGLVAVSTADPADPVIEGAWTTQYVHEATIVSYHTGPYDGKEIAFCFAAGPYYGYGTGLAIVDVTDKANMVTLCNVSYPGIQFCHQGWLSEDRKYLYVDDELDGPNQGVPSPFTRVFDISNLSNPVYLGGFSTPGNTAIDHNQYTRGRMLFQSDYRSGLRVFDATNQAAPTEVAYFDTYPDDNNANYNGAWGNYPMLPSGTILISDIERGLFLVRLERKLLVSFKTTTTLPGAGKAANEDIVQYDQSTGQWSLVFDGSDVGLATAVIDGMAVVRGTPDRLLLSFAAEVSIPGLIGGPGGGTLVDDSDIVMFTPSSLGANTAGTFSFYFDGSDVGLTTNAEDIDAITMTPDGRLVISTLGTARANGVASAADEDLLAFNSVNLGENTQGSFEVYFDGSDVGLGDGADFEDVDAASITTDGMVMLSTQGAFSVPGAGGTATGSSQDILRFSPTTLGQTTSGWSGLFQSLSILGIDPAKNVGSLEVIVKSLSVN